MSIRKRNVSAKEIVSFTPAELREGKDWLVVYYVKNPVTGRLERFRNRVPKITNKKERLRYAQKMVDTINTNLYNGWSPFMEQSNNELKTIEFCCQFYLKTIEKEVRDNVKRVKTLDNNKQFIRKFSTYLSERYKNLHLMVELTAKELNAFMDKLYFEDRLSSTTYNTHLKNLKAFLNFCVAREYIADNPAKNIKRKVSVEKKRVVLNEQEKAKLATLRGDDFHFYVYCMATYYCFIRPKELMMLKVEDVNLEEQYITIPAEISKNKKTQNVTIPSAFFDDLKRHIEGARGEFLLFGDYYAPSEKGLTYGYHRKKWEKIRERLGLRKEVQFYSLKDTGITDLLNTGMPAIKVRDQARHSDLKITETYTTRNKFADEMLKVAKFEF